MAEENGKVRYGLTKLHIAFAKGDGTWDVPVEIDGVVKCDLSPAGGTTDFYAADRKFFSATNNNGYTGSIETALIPDEILAKATGSRVDSNGGVVEIADGKQKHFAMGFEVDGNVSHQRTWFYDCVMTRPTGSHSTTEDSITVQTEWADITVLPTFIDAEKVVKYTLEESTTNAAVFSKFFEAVTKPAAVV